MFKKYAFTLVELIVVITILAILGTIAFINLQGYSMEARDSKRLSDVNNTYKKITLERVKGVYPSNVMKDSIDTATGLTIGGVIPNDSKQGKVNYVEIKEEEDNFKDPKGSNYVFSYAVGGSGTGAYKFIQLATINEQRNEAVVVGDYYKLEITDSESIVFSDPTNLNSPKVVNEQSVLPYSPTGVQEIYSCAIQPSYTNAIFTEGDPKVVDEPWQNTNNANACYYECTGGYSGAECTILPICDPNYTYNTGTSSCEANDYTATFDGNGGSGHTPTSKSVAYNTAVGTLPSNPTRTGYTFNGWFTAASGGTQVTISTIVMGDVTYYAQWSINSYTATFDGNGGSGHTPTSKSVAYNTAVGTLPSNPTRTGYTFNGWFTATSGGTQVTISTIVMGDVTYYAQWAQNPTCGTANGVATATTPTTNLCTYGTPSTVSAYIIDYQWSCSNAPATSVNCSALRQYVVTFNSNGGNTPSPTSKNVTFNTAVGTLATVTRTGYTFNGWFTAASGGTQITTGTVITGNVTYYAQWTGNNYTWTYIGCIPAYYHDCPGGTDFDLSCTTFGVQCALGGAAPYCGGDPDGSAILRCQ